MNHKKNLKLYLISILLLITVLISYKIYLVVYETDYQALNTENLYLIEAELNGKTSYSFAVIGNIRNSMRIFEKRIAPLIQDNEADFMISVGNAVYDGAEGRYRLLCRGLGKLGIPYLLTVGHNETEDFGAGRFYRHFGPYFFSFHLENAYFIFLDSTGLTSWEWQIRWLKQELTNAGNYPYRFVFLNHSIFPLPGYAPNKTHYVIEENLSRDLQRLFSEHGVSAVFSAGYPTYHETVSQGVRYIISGDGGGLLLERSRPYQFLKIDVKAGQIVYQNVSAAARLGLFQEKLEILKLFLHSFFYMNLFNSLLILCIVGLIAVRLYLQILRQQNLYRDFNFDEQMIPQKPLRVAMFTNNYLPFIGGVSLSVDRLHRGLLQLGSAVKIFAPDYQQSWTDPDDVSIVRCPALFHTRKERFPVANIFSRKIEMEFRSFDCDLVHVHHPFWLGGKGMRLARKGGIPVILTYHTRLEHYTHYFPLPGTALKNIVAHYMIKRFANNCDAIITPTASTEEYLRNLGVSALIETIPTGISLEDYKQWSPKEVRSLRDQYASPGESLLISVSRMAKEKNIDFLIAGLAKVKERSHVPFKCLLVGDGPEKTRLEEKAKKLGLKDHLVFTGNVTPLEVVRHYLAADLFVFTSTSETQGMVLLEAMAGGCPVVAVRGSGVYDVVKDGFNGYKVAESTDNWAEAIICLLSDRKQLSILSENSRLFAEKFSLENITEKILILYRRTIVHSASKNR